MRPLGGGRRLAAVSPSTLEKRPPRGVAPESYDDVGRVVAVLGGSSRKGSWEPPARLRVLALMGGVELDFREANLLEGETVVDVLAVMGGVTIVVPPDVDVETSGTGFLGGFGGVSNHAKETNAPLLRIRGLAVMGSVDVKVKKLPLKKRLLAD
jgi:hypothetical protein